MKRMHRVVAAAALSSVVSIGLVAGCQSMKNEKNKVSADMHKNSAIAVIKPAGGASTQPSWGHANGTITFEPKGDKIVIHGDLSGLPPGRHGIHIHEKGDLSAPDLMSAGGHYDPEMHKMHGGPSTNPMIHAGDLGNITADASGKATLDITVDNITIGGSKDDILGKSVIIHAKADDFRTQPSGASGARIAGGVIEKGR
jgi:Cu-Zn family superoxide dismutase